MLLVPDFITPTVAIPRHVGFAIGLVAAFGAGLVVAHEAAGDDTAPLPPNVKADAIPVEKSARRMTLLRGGQTHATYRVSLGSGGLAPKRREGDRLVPQGRYRIEWRNPKSGYHRSLKVSYPSPEDVRGAAGRGEPAGSNIMIHGVPNGLGWIGRMHRLVDWTAGCVAVTNAEMDDIWRAVPDGAPIEIRA